MIRVKGCFNGEKIKVLTSISRRLGGGGGGRGARGNFFLWIVTLYVFDFTDLCAIWSKRNGWLIQKEVPNRLNHQKE